MHENLQVLIRLHAAIAIIYNIYLVIGCHEKDAISSKHGQVNTYAEHM